LKQILSEWPFGGFQVDKEHLIEGMYPLKRTPDAGRRFWLKTDAKIEIPKKIATE
jgi:hypothetical protein